MDKSKTFEAEILHTKILSPDVKLIKLSTPEDFEFIPGQFILVSFKKQGKPIRRAYSIASDSSKKGYIELTIKKISGGVASTYLHNLKVGDIIKIQGPFGEFTAEDSDKDVVFISVGVGICPFRSIINHLIQSGFEHKITLITGHRYEDEILYKDEFEHLASNYKNFRYFIIINRPRKLDYAGERGYVQKLVEKYIPRNSQSLFYLCGFGEMIDQVHDILLEMEISKQNIHFEKYG